MRSYNGARRGGLKDLGECWYWCDLCPTGEQRWLPGGQTALDKHQRQHHGTESPTFHRVDAERFLVDDHGNRVMANDKPVRAPIDAPWIRTRPTKPRLYKEGNR